MAIGEEVKEEANYLSVIYEHIWKTMGFIDDPQARTSATATIMIAIKDAYKYHPIPTKQEAPKADFQTAKEILDQQKKPEATKPEAGKIMWSPGDDGTPAFDKVKKLWNYCPICKDKPRTWPDKKDPSKTKSACYKCRIWLNDDGNTRGMDDGKK